LNEAEEPQEAPMQQQPRTAHPYHMYDAILAQPDAIERVLFLEEDAVDGLAEALRGAERLHIVGIGTSWHAALVGEHLLRTVGGRSDVRAWNSFEFCLQGPSLGAEDAVILLSHRGTKRYSMEALIAARAAGVQTAIITGIDSAISEGEAAHVVRTSTMERSAAFTVSHTTALTVLAMLAVRLGGEPAEGLRPAVAQLYVLADWAVATEVRVRALARELKDTRWFAIAGSGANVATAYEGALKLNEAAYALAQGFQMEQLLHGPFVAFDDRDALVVVSGPGKQQERAIELVRAAAAVGVHTIVIADETEATLAKACKTFIGMPAVPEALTPITFLPPLQLLAYWLGMERGTNPDSFRLQEPAHQRSREFYSL
jgi:glutamine---fructose-6-phosphate transaminase (isomerizing)